MYKSLIFLGSLIRVEVLPLHFNLGDDLLLEHDFSLVKYTLRFNQKLTIRLYLQTKKFFSSNSYKILCFQVRIFLIIPTWMFCQWITCFRSCKYLFIRDTWKTLCTQMRLGKANPYAIGPTLSNIWKGPQNLGANLAQETHLKVFLFGLIRTYTWSPTSHSQ